MSIREMTRFAWFSCARVDEFEEFWTAMHGWKQVTDWWNEQGGLFPMKVNMGMGMKDSDDL